MISGFFGWLLSLVLAFSAGVSVGNRTEAPSNSELQQKVQDHMDVIVDESAAIVDDVTDEIRKNEHVQKAEEFADDVKEIAQNTKNDIEDHFGSKEAETEEEVPEEAAPEAETEEMEPQEIE